MSLRPTLDRILIRRDEQVKTIGRIILPSGARAVPQGGIVAAVGPGGYDRFGKYHSVRCQVGQRVYWNKYDGTEIEDKGEKFWVLCDEKVLATE